MYLSRSITSSAPSLYCEEEAGGMAIPSTAFGYGSSYPLDTKSEFCVGFLYDSFTDGTTVCLLPILEGFLRKRLGRGLSCVDADEPDTREGVRVGSKRASLDVGKGFI
jgi:hypothetical protein